LPDNKYCDNELLVGRSEICPNNKSPFCFQKFEKPGRKNFDYPQMAKEAATKALADAKINLAEVKQAVCGYVYGDSTSGQRALYEVGMTGEDSSRDWLSIVFQTALKFSDPTEHFQAFPSTTSTTTAQLELQLCFLPSSWLKLETTIASWHLVSRRWSVDR
jgi:hypothetical protein